MRIKAIAFLAVLMLNVLVGCSLKSEEEVLDEIKELAKTTFEEEVETNTELEGFGYRIYLPSKFEVVEETNYNLVLEQEEQTYILFYNPLEETTSRLNYEEAAEQQDENYLLLESFESNQRFGYIKLESRGEQGKELQIGVGGVKITTITTKEDIESDTKEMMKMANSIAY